MAEVFFTEPLDTVTALKVLPAGFSTERWAVATGARAAQAMVAAMALCCARC